MECQYSWNPLPLVHQRVHHGTLLMMRATAVATLILLIGLDWGMICSTDAFSHHFTVRYGRWDQSSQLFLVQSTTGGQQHTPNSRHQHKTTNNKMYPHPLYFNPSRLSFNLDSSSTSRRPSTRSGAPRYMAVGKTGGHVIASSEDYKTTVMGSMDSSSTTTTLSRPVMVFWTAPWCGPCRLSVPVVKDIVKQFGNKLKVVEVCTDDLPDVASEAGIVSIPTIQLWYKGELKDTIIGCVARSVLATAIAEVLGDASD